MSLLTAVRYGLPAVVVVAGIVIFLIDPDVNRFEGAAGLIGAGLSILLFNILFRAGVQGDRERAEEERARRHFDEHGRWPDDDQRPAGEP